ncbi:hypothetical protein [Streptomyces sp. CBMA123]|uniref:hypothetical protein n=1 Tax=Streptomyces sp. CBMA123 TaxID=1896313 RepID=UPI0016619CFF|nr:hypothetical protein [Streptomyces sp. CBMA123]MBD0690944.1 hypothetical protein [Streptomyces sp. CBMA123]
MSDQNPYGQPPQPGYPATPPPAAPGYDGVPPQTPPPGYPAPAGPEAAGYPGYGGYAPVPPPRKSRRTLWIVLGTVAAVILLGGGTLAYFVWNATSNAGTQKIVLPATFKDLSRNDDSEVTSAMEKAMTDSLGQGDGNWKPTGVAGMYQNAQSDPQILVAGAYGKVLLPKQELDQAFNGVGGKGGATVTDRHTVDAGPKGGTMECGVMTESDSKVGMCAWADSSSLVIVMQMPGDGGGQPDLDKLASDTRDLRAVAEVAK